MRQFGLALAAADGLPQALVRQSIWTAARRTRLNHAARIETKCGHSHREPWTLDYLAFLSTTCSSACETAVGRVVLPGVASPMDSVSASVSS